MNKTSYPFHDSSGAVLLWKERNIAVLRVKQKHGWKPLLALGVFLAGWYTALMTAIDFGTVSPAWRALWQALRAEPPLLVVFLIPLFPVIMVTRDILGHNRLVLNRGDRTIYRGRKRLMGFDAVSGLLIRQRSKKSMSAAVDLSLQVNGGRKIFLARCPSYEAGSLLAHEIATVVNAPVKSG